MKKNNLYIMIFYLFYVENYKWIKKTDKKERQHLLTHNHNTATLLDTKCTQDPTYYVEY